MSARPCPICAGAGYVLLAAREQTIAHYKRKGEAEHALVERRVTFRAPCVCPVGEAWIEARKRGKELEP